MIKKFQNAKVIKYNGITIIYRKNKINNTTNLTFGIRSGAFNEHFQGVAHFYEHMMFKETEHRSYDEVSAILKEKLSDLNAYTSYNSMCITCCDTTRKIDLMFDVLSDLYFCGTNNQNFIDQERPVIEQEIVKNFNQHGRVLTYTQNYQIYKNKKLKLELCGDLKTLSNIKTSDLMRFRKENIFRENFLLSINTNKTLSYVKLLIDKYILPKLPSKPELTVKKSYNLKITDISSIELIERKELTKNIMVLAFNGFGINEQDCQLIFNYYLIPSISGIKRRLWNIFREKNNLVYSSPILNYVSSNYDGFIYFSLTTTKNNLKDCIKLFSELVKDLHQNGITKEEYNICCEEFKNIKDFYYDNPNKHSEKLWNQYNLVNRIYKNYEKLNLAMKFSFEEVNEIIKKIINPKVVWLSIIGDMQNKDVYTLNEIKKMFL